MKYSYNYHDVYHIHLEYGNCVCVWSPTRIMDNRKIGKSATKSYTTKMIFSTKRLVMKKDLNL